MIRSDQLRLLFLSTPVAPLGSGIGGGVELSLRSLTGSLLERGHTIDIVAPETSRQEEGAGLISLPGELQPKAQHLPRDYRPARTAHGEEPTFLQRMCDYARRHQGRYDLIVNFSYDLYPLQLTHELDTPLAHLISMGSLYDAFDHELNEISDRFPGRLACYTRSQAETFPRPDAFRSLGGGIDLRNYRFCPQPESYLLWLGRICREKATADAVQVAQQTGTPLLIAGMVEDPDYWNEICDRYAGAPFAYAGFLTADPLQKLIGGARAMLMTPRWMEAFGLVVIESLACGVPVISYRRGGPSEIVEEGKTGFLTPPDSIEGVVEAVGKIDRISRADCRRAIETNYTLQAWTDRIETWLRSILTNGEVAI